MTPRQRLHNRLVDEAYALYTRLDGLWTEMYLNHEHSPRRTRLAVLAQKAFSRYQDRLALPAIIVPPAPRPVYTLALGVITATFKDGTTWLQTAPERWVLVVNLVVNEVA